jgi:2Fe-2S ferredoxin
VGVRNAWVCVDIGLLTQFLCYGGTGNRGKELLMAKITFITHDETVHIVDADDGSFVMNAAIDNLVPGIDADCGGECSCATCHVVVDDQWIGVVGQPGEREESMLDLNPEREPNSRLSCQIPVTEEIDGIVVRVPEFQM